MTLFFQFITLANGRKYFHNESMRAASKLLVWFHEVDHDDVSLIGAKAAKLGDLARSDFPIPEGFVVTSTAYFSFLKENNLQQGVADLLAKVNFSDTKSLDAISLQIKKKIIEGKISPELSESVFLAYRKLGNSFFRHIPVTIHSSNTSEKEQNNASTDVGASFYLVHGEASVLVRIKEAWASFFDPRALWYRHEKHIGSFSVGVAVTVQKMIEAEKSGVMYTYNLLTGDKTHIVIEAVFGERARDTYEGINPDYYEVAKNTNEITFKRISDQGLYLQKKREGTKKIMIARRQQHIQKLTNEQIISLAKLGASIEKHFYFPQEVQWVIAKKKIYVTKISPITTTGKPTGENFGSLLSTHETISTGKPLSPGIASGPIRFIKSAKDFTAIQRGDIIVLTSKKKLDMKQISKAGGVISNFANDMTFANSIKHMGIPGVSHVLDTTSVLKQGVITSINGNTGHVYKGGFQRTGNTTQKGIHEGIRATKLFVTLQDLAAAKDIAKLSVDGVGEFQSSLLLNNLRIHPRLLMRSGKGGEYKEAIVKELTDCCKAFSPRPVFYKASDLTSLDYRRLEGGKEIETREINPAIGYRGAVRYVHDSEVFALELEAIKYVREHRGYKNLSILLPFVRSVTELQEVKALLLRHGLYRSHSFKLWLSVSTPSMVITLEKFLDEGVDGLVIDISDLTMLLLGVDGQNTEMINMYTHQTEALLWSLARIIDKAAQNQVPVCLSLQNPESEPLILEKAVQWGITCVSVPQNYLSEVSRILSLIEQGMIKKK